MVKYADPFVMLQTAIFENNFDQRFIISNLQ